MGDFRDLSLGYVADLYLQHVTASGQIAPGWPVDGLPISTGPGGQAEVWKMLLDGSGGVLIVCGDTRFDFGDLYLQRITATGTIAPRWPPSGVPVGIGPG